jgi:hypothetical protein
VVVRIGEEEEARGDMVDIRTEAGEEEGEAIKEGVAIKEGGVTLSSPSGEVTTRTGVVEAAEDEVETSEVQSYLSLK